MFSESVKENLQKFSGQEDFLGVITKMPATGKFNMTIPLPTKTSIYSNITCGEFRPAGQTTIKDTNPEIELRSNQITLNTSVSGFNNYVGCEGLARITFS